MALLKTSGATAALIFVCVWAGILTYTQWHLAPSLTRSVWVSRHRSALQHHSKTKANLPEFGMSRFSVQEVEVNKRPMVMRNDRDYEEAWETFGSVEARLTRVFFHFILITKVDWCIVQIDNSRKCNPVFRRAKHPR
jgi:hypothetical protein